MVENRSVTCATLRFQPGTVREIGDVLNTQELPADPQGQLVAITEALEETTQFAHREHTQLTMYGSMVHKLKSPLTAISGYAETLQARLNQFSQEQILSKIEKIIDNAKEMSRLIETDLECIRNDFCGWESELQEVDINVTLMTLVDDLSLFYSNINLFPPRLTCPRANSDTKILAIIIQHLVENASKHGIENKGIEIRVTELPTRVGVHVTNWCQEDGTPILEEFQPFLGKNRGLGLYIVRQYTESMGGTLSVQQVTEENERRVTFSLWLQKQSSEYASLGEASLETSVGS